MVGWSATETASTIVATLYEKEQKNKDKDRLRGDSPEKEHLPGDPLQKEFLRVNFSEENSHQLREQVSQFDRFAKMCEFGEPDKAKSQGESRLNGEIKWFNQVKGYGFIIRPGDEHEIFVHYSGLANAQDRSFQPGDRVSFIVVTGDRGPKAIDVRRIA